MKILPSTPSASLTFTELKVFDLVRRVDWGPGAMGLASVNLSEHEYKRWGELDFVLIGQHGLFAIEVKGGDVSCRDGVWHYGRGERSFSRPESPFVQVKGSFFSLERLLSRHRNLDLPGPIPGGFCVIFASMRREDLRGMVGGPELPTEITGSLEDLGTPEAFRRFLDRVARHWQQNTGRQSPAWNASRIKQVVQFLRPEFDRVVPVSLRVSALREERVRLTEEQYDTLDFLEDRPRLLITGGAGCGKTFLGIEAARREHAAGSHVLVLTGTETLAGYLRREGSIPAGVTVRSISEALADDSVPRPLYDVVIVDEGQQVTTPEVWKLLERVVHGGAEGGRWRWFADYTRQVALDSTVDDGTLELLRMASIHQQLFHNCRNTPQLVEAAETISGIKMGRALVRGAGPQLHWDRGATRAQLKDAASQRLLAWLRSDTSPESIVLLYASDAGREDAIAAAALAGAETVPWGDTYRRMRRSAQLPISSIEEFRGLESEHVLIFGLDDIVDDREVRALGYLAITRATFAAAIACLEQLPRRLATLVGQGDN